MPVRAWFLSMKRAACFGLPRRQEASPRSPGLSRTSLGRLVAESFPLLAARRTTTSTLRSRAESSRRLFRGELFDFDANKRCYLP